MVCLNPRLRRERARKREDLLRATEGTLEVIAASARSGRLKDRQAIDRRVGRDANRRKMAKHLKVTVTGGGVSWPIREDRIEAEARLDGVYPRGPCAVRPARIRPVPKEPQPSRARIAGAGDQKEERFHLFRHIFPTSLDNQFPGHKIALYLFYALTALTLWRSQHHLFAHDGGAQSIASIPLDSYPSSAAETVIGIFGLWGLSQLIIGLIYLLAAVRYRALIPILYLLFTIEYAMRLWVGANTTIETTGTAPGSVINLPFMLAGVILFALSVWRPKPK